MIQSFSSPVVACRPALSSDRADVFEFTKFIWEGRDYIRYVWDEWFADPNGILVAAEYGGHCVGIAKVSLSAPRQWWLQGFRVNPAYQDLKIGSHIHAYVDGWWLEHGDGVVRLMTSSKRVKVHHLCEKLGYTKILEVKELEASLVDEACTNFQPVQADEIPLALKVAQNAPIMKVSHGLLDLGWDAIQPTEDLLASIQQKGMAFWWRGREGLLLEWEHWSDEGMMLGIGLPACAIEALPELLYDARRLASQQGRIGVFWISPLTAEILSVAEKTGYYHHREHSGYLYEKWHTLSGTSPTRA